jgi:hypothetical protein
LQLIINNQGDTRCIYDESIPLRQLGHIKIRRGSHVEPTSGGKWIADMKPVDGPVLGPFSMRSQALAAERRWLEKHWLPIS